MEENIESLTEQVKCEIMVLKDMLYRSAWYLGHNDEYHTSTPMREEIEEFLRQVRAVLSGEEIEHG